MASCHQESPSLQLTKPAALLDAPGHARVAPGPEMGTSPVVDGDHPLLLWEQTRERMGSHGLTSPVPQCTLLPPKPLPVPASRSQGTARSAMFRALPWSEVRSLEKTAGDLVFSFVLTSFRCFCAGSIPVPCVSLARAGSGAHRCLHERSMAAGDLFVSWPLQFSM